MTTPKELFLLEQNTDNPIFEGFGVADIDEPSLLGRDDITEDMNPGYGVETRDWQVARLADVWKPLEVEGRVVPFNDYPCVDGYPAFSKRACDVLRQYLEPNGELLPLDSTQGEYFFYNITKVADVLNTAKSECLFSPDRPTVALGIDRYDFFADRLAGLSIFRICDQPQDVIVTDEFVRAVQENGLQGFRFYKIWPLSEGMNWRKYNAEVMHDINQTRKDLEQNTLVLILGLAGKTAKGGEKKRIAEIENELDALLTLKSPIEPFYGIYKGSDEVDSEFRMFISCPDVDKLVKRLTSWLETLHWGGKVVLMKRYGDMYDKDAREEVSGN